MTGLTQWPSGLEWLAVFPMLSVLIFVHELGHFLAALWMRVGVEEFGFGYPPRMFTLFERRGVKYSINWIPFGGFVKMVGEEGDFEAEGSLVSKKPWQRAIVLFAGPFMSLLLAVIVFSLIFFIIGTPTFTGYVQVEQVALDSPSSRAGIQAGDIMLSVAGTEIHTTTDVSETTDRYLGQEVELILRRDGERLSVTLTPRRPEDTPPRQGAMGVVISNEIIYLRASMWQAIVQGASQTVEVTILIVNSLSMIMRALLIPAESLPEGGVAGPIGIARITGELVKQGWLPVLNLTAFLSLNFFLLNLLPLPALDGGRLVFVFLEWIRGGKRVSPEREAMVHLVGMALLVALMFVVSYFDLVHWIRGDALIPGR